MYFHCYQSLLFIWLLFIYLFVCLFIFIIIDHLFFYLLIYLLSLKYLFIILLFIHLFIIIIWSFFEKNIYSFIRFNNLKFYRKIYQWRNFWKRQDSLGDMHKFIFEIKKKKFFWWIRRRVGREEDSLEGMTSNCYKKL